MNRMYDFTNYIIFFAMVEKLFVSKVILTLK